MTNKKIFLISDTHFGHYNIIKYHNRPYASADEMDEMLIKNWNETVGKDDQVIHLGDFSWHKSFEKTKAICDRLNGDITLVLGNHDRNPAEIENLKRTGRFSQISPYPLLLEDKYLLSHEPLTIGSSFPFINVHGHVHTNPYSEKTPFHLNISIECTNYRPIAFANIEARTANIALLDETSRWLLILDSIEGMNRRLKEGAWSPQDKNDVYAMKDKIIEKILIHKPSCLNINLFNHGKGQILMQIECLSHKFELHFPQSLASKCNVDVSSLPIKEWIPESEFHIQQWKEEKCKIEELLRQLYPNGEIPVNPEPPKPVVEKAIANEALEIKANDVNYRFRFCPKGNVENGFWMLETPVTQEMYEALMNLNPSNFKGKNLPVEQVSYSDCQEFIKRLNQNLKEYVASLPTDEEWEYACRAGSQTTYFFGDRREQLGQYAWYFDNSNGQTHDVGQKSPNDWGLYDMHGNVWEWVDNYYFRGGSYDKYAKGCRSSSRDRGNANSAYKDLGFRFIIRKKGSC